MGDLEGQVAIVTGAGTGVGQACAVALVRDGAIVVLVGRTAASLEHTAQSASHAGGRARLTIAPCDVTVRAAVEELVARTIEEHGAVDILVNNAGINVPRRALKDLAWDDWQRIVNVNLHGCYHSAQAVLPHMRARGSGTLIHIGSYAARRPGTLSGAAYTAAKAGLAALSAVINAEEGANGVRSTVITLGDTDTPLLDFRPAPPSAEARALALQPEDVAACVRLAAALPRRVTIEEIVVAPTIKG